jgi:hypothetical protein
MSSSSSGSSGAADLPQGSPAESASPAGRPYDRSLLENVLRQTLEDSEAGMPLEGADKEALLQVAQRHRQEPFSLEPIVVELVQAVLRTHFDKRSDSSEFWGVVSAQIAQTLFEDPVASPRLERLWRRLGRMRS